MAKWTHKPTWKDRSCETDRSVSRDGEDVARIYQYKSGPSRGLWAWFLKIGGNTGSGAEETLKEALEAVRLELVARAYEDIGFPSHSITVGRLAMSAIPVKASCDDCALDTKVDFKTLIKCNTSRYSLINKKGYCRRYGCDGRVRFFYQDGHENWHALQSVRLGCHLCEFKLHHTLSDIVQIYGQTVHPDNLIPRVHKKHGCSRDIAQCAMKIISAI